jgi:hypothetical protein
MKLPNLIALTLTLPLLSSAAHAALSERDCKGKAQHGGKIRASLQLSDDSTGYLTIDSRGYRLKFEKDTKKGNEKYSSKEHGGLEMKVDTRARYVEGESDKLGSFTLVCKPASTKEFDDESDGDMDLPSLYFSSDTDT